MTSFVQLFQLGLVLELIFFAGTSDGRVDHAVTVHEFVQSSFQVSIVLLQQTEIDPVVLESHLVKLGQLGSPLETSFFLLVLLLVQDLANFFYVAIGHDQQLLDPPDAVESFALELFELGSIRRIGMRAMREMREMRVRMMRSSMHWAFRVTSHHSRVGKHSSAAVTASSVSVTFVFVYDFNTVRVTRSYGDTESSGIRGNGNTDLLAGWYRDFNG